MPDPKIELEMFGKMTKCSVEYQRGTATADYAANDVVAGSAAGVFEIPNAGRWPGSSQYLVGLRAVIDTPSITPRFRVHFFNSSAATVAADNAKWAETYAQTSLRTGYADLPAMTTGGAGTAACDMSRSMDMTLRVPMFCAAGTTSLWFAIETLDAFTPKGSDKITIISLWDQN